MNRFRLIGPLRHTVTALLLLAAASKGWAQGFDKINTTVTNVNTILVTISIAVVTIAIIFAGYQIAFAHKRISDVAPILIGGLLIGAAGQIASMIMPDNEACTTGTPTGSISIEASQYENA